MEKESLKSEVEIETLSEQDLEEAAGGVPVKYCSLANCSGGDPQ